jgi:hypothetical protein
VGPRTVRLLHISDLHMRSAAGPQGKRAEREAPFRWRVIGEEWRRNLDEIRGDGRPFDLIAFTGDLGDWGHPTDYPAAVEFLLELCVALSVPLQHLFVISGNHDVDRARQHSAWKGLREKLRQTSAGAVSEWMAGGNAPPGFDAAWRDGVLERQAGFWHAISIDLERPGLAPSQSPHGRLGYRSTIALDRLAVPVHIIGLDTAWLAGDDSDTGNLWLTEHQVELLGSDRGAPLSGLRIALMHHGFADLADGNRTKQLLAGRADVVLHGHQHEPTASSWNDPDRNLLVLAAGCLYEGDHQHRYLNAHQVVDFNVAGDGRLQGVELRFRGWSERGLFWGDDALLYRSARNGRLGLRRQADGWTVGEPASGDAPGDHVDGGPLGTADASSSRSSALVNVWSSVPMSWQVEAFLSEHGSFAGAELGNYVLCEPLGIGGSGIVFKAVHQTLGRLVALKLCYPLPGPRHEIVKATERAVRGLASLQHPGIVPLLDFGYLEMPAATSVYLVMELVDGASLDVWNKQLEQDDSAMTTKKRLGVATEIAEALTAAHRYSFVGNLGVAETGVFHGDVKPSNILVRRADARPILVDFMIPDLQRLLGSHDHERTGLRGWTRTANEHRRYFDNLTALTALFGTPGYMPPEQEVDGIVLPASDVYSLGMTLRDLFASDCYLSSVAGKDRGRDLIQLLATMTMPQVVDRPKTMAIVLRRLRKIRSRW